MFAMNYKHFTGWTWWTPRIVDGSVLPLTSQYKNRIPIIPHISLQYPMHIPQEGDPPTSKLLFFCLTIDVSITNPTYSGNML